MKTKLTAILKVILIGIIFNLGLSQAIHATESVHTIKYKTVKIDGLDIFYREAGNPNHPTILLLHGFPTSSHMFRVSISIENFPPVSVQKFPPGLVG